MFEQDFFNDTEDEQSDVSRWTGKAAKWGLHAAKIMFLLYSGYHGVSASLNYAGSSEIAKAAQIFGIVVLELVLLSLYVAFHNRQITGAGQQVVAGTTYAIGFVLACLGIVADSQLHADVTMSGWLVTYLMWGLPIAPAVMALGAAAVHELDPQQTRGRRQAKDRTDFANEQFKVQMNAARAEMEAQKAIKNMQLNARMATAKRIAAWYNGEGAQAAITENAKRNAPNLLRQIGIEIDSDPDKEDREPAIDPERLREWAQPQTGNGNSYNQPDGDMTFKELGNELGITPTPKRNIDDEDKWQPAVLQRDGTWFVPGTAERRNTAYHFGVRMAEAVPGESIVILVDQNKDPHPDHAKWAREVGYDKEATYKYATDKQPPAPKPTTPTDQPVVPTPTGPNGNGLGPDHKQRS